MYRIGCWNTSTGFGRRMTATGHRRRATTKSYTATTWRRWNRCCQRRSREVHLYRSTVQHGQRKVGLQRQRERPENQEVAGRGRGQAGRGFEPPRQVALHDVSRLKLLHKLLAEDGTIFISIDDNELANLKLLCDEIFGVNNFIDIFSWHKTYSPSNLSHRTKSV